MDMRGRSWRDILFVNEFEFIKILLISLLNVFVKGLII